MLEVLDTFIGLFTIYLILSLIVTAMGEGVSVHLNLKGRTVRDIVTNLLGKDDGEKPENIRIFCEDTFLLLINAEIST